MSEQTSKKQKLLNHLQKRGSITKLEALSMFGLWNVGGRILELRRDGHDIKTEMVERFGKGAKKVRVAKYILKSE